MKKLLGVIFLFAMLMVLSGANAVTSSGLSVSIPKYEPYPVEPGQYFDLWVKVQNSGSMDATNAVIKVLPEYPFSIDSAESSIKTINIISGGQEEIIKFKVRVDAKAVEGTNILKIQYSYDTYDALTKDFEILVQTRDAILTINEIKRTPESFVPGESSQLNITMQNQADSTLSDISVKLDLSNTSMPFTTINTASEKRVRVLEAGETQSVSFDLLTFPSAESKIYKVPVDITYYDNVGTKYEREEYLGIIVGGAPVIDVILDKATIKQGNNAGSVTFEIINKGLNDLKFLTVQLEKSADYEITSQSKLYIGELKSDDTDSFDVSLFVKATGKSSILLPVTLSYLDSNNKAYELTENVELKLYTNSELSTYGLNGGGNNGMPIVALVVVALGAWLAYNKFIKKK
jgi:hypothetical protein